MLTEKVFFQRSLVTMILVAIFVVVVSVISIVLLVTYVRGLPSDDNQKPMNILFIVVDDLRPALGCYGDKKAITPNIDQLASQGILFMNAYAQQSLCGPSRTSFLTSRRPDTLHLYSNTGVYFRDAMWNFTTIPEHFKDNGYETISIGKVFHHGDISGGNDDYPYSWSEEPFRPKTMQYKMSPVCPTPEGKFMNLVCPVEVKDQPEGTLPDLEVIQYAIDYLNNRPLNPNKTAPFFLGVGFYKPHIPFKFPREYLDLYPFESMDLAPNRTKPEAMPSIAWNPWMDLRERHDVNLLNSSFPFGPLPDNFQKLIRQGYYASVSYMDDQLGKLLEALEKNDLASNTAIFFLGDHGWSLGEHGEWSKYSNFDVSVRVPLIAYIPGLTVNAPAFGNTAAETPPPRFKYIPVLDATLKNQTSFKAKYIAKEMVELVDLFPTLAEVADIAVPPICQLHSNTTSFCSEGVSFYPVIENHVSPSVDFSWKAAVFSQYPRPTLQPRNDSDQPTLKKIRYMGYSIKDDHFRYTRWVKYNNFLYYPVWSPAGFVDDELYDENEDPYEAINIAEKPSHALTVKNYFRKLKKGWRYELPYAVYQSAHP